MKKVKRYYLVPVECISHNEIAVHATSKDEAMKMAEQEGMEGCDYAIADDGNVEIISKETYKVYKCE